MAENKESVKLKMLYKIIPPFGDYNTTIGFSRDELLSYLTSEYRNNY